MLKRNLSYSEVSTAALPGFATLQVAVYSATSKRSSILLALCRTGGDRSEVRSRKTTHASRHCFKRCVGLQGVFTPENLLKHGGVPDKRAQMMREISPRMDDDDDKFY